MHHLRHTTQVIHEYVKVFHIILNKLKWFTQDKLVHCFGLLRDNHHGEVLTVCNTISDLQNWSFWPVSIRSKRYFVILWFFSHLGRTVYSSHFSFPTPLRWWQVHNNFPPAEQLSWQQFKKLGQDKRTNSFPNETPSQHYCRLFIRKCEALVFIILWSIGVMAPKRSLSGPSLLINVLCKCSFFLPKSASKRFKLKLKHFSTIISSWRWIAYTCSHTPPYE